MAVPAWCVVADQRRRKCHKRRELKSGKEMKIDGDLEKKAAALVCNVSREKGEKISSNARLESPIVDRMKPRCRS